MGMIQDKNPRAAKPRAAKPRALPSSSTSGSTPVWHGSAALEMQPGSPDIHDALDGSTRTTLVYAGPYAAVAAERPARGTAVSGFDGRVTESRLVHGRGGKGVLTVILLAEAVSAPEPNPEDPEPTPLFLRWEINWLPTEKPITSNPKLVTQGSGTTQTCIDEVEAWRSSPQQRKRNYQIPKAELTGEADPRTDADWVALTGESLKVAQKIAAGVEAWLEFNPVVTRVRIYATRVLTGGCGMIGAPTVSVTGYQYLKNGDNMVQLADGTWQRTETWQGSAKWDTDLYEAAP